MAKSDQWQWVCLRPLWDSMHKHSFQECRMICANVDFACQNEHGSYKDAPVGSAGVECLRSIFGGRQGWYFFLFHPNPLGWWSGEQVRSSGHISCCLLSSPGRLRRLFALDHHLLSKALLLPHPLIAPACRPQWCLNQQRLNSPIFKKCSRICLLIWRYQHEMQCENSKPRNARNAWKCSPLPGYRHWSHR